MTPHTINERLIVNLLIDSVFIVAYPHQISKMAIFPAPLVRIHVRVGN